MRHLLNVALRGVGNALPANPVMDRLYRAVVPRFDLVPAPTVVRLAHGQSFRVFRSRPGELLNNPDYYLYYFGVWEPRNSRALARLICPGDICFDVGANVGWYTLLLSRLAGPTGAVHAFEPDPDAFATLQDNLALNPWATGARLNRLALGKASGAATLYRRPVSLYSSLYDLRADGGAQEAIQVTTIEEYCRQHGIARIDFLKCDVEGSEFAVVQGAERLLRESASPPIIQLEANTGTFRGAGYRIEDLLQWLTDVAGYQFYVPNAAGRLVHARTMQDCADRDVYCAIPARHADRLAGAGVSLPV